VLPIFLRVTLCKAKVLRMREFFRRLGLTALVFAGWFVALPVQAASPAVGDMRNFVLHEKPVAVADVPFKDADGAELKLSNFRGRIVMLNLWATWCAPCRREMPALDALQSKYGGDDFIVLALSQDRKGVDAVKKFYGEIGVKSLVVYIDQRAKSSRKLRAPGLPTTLLLGRDGQELGRLIGPAEWASEDSEHLVEYFLKR